MTAAAAVAVAILLPVLGRLLTGKWPGEARRLAPVVPIFYLFILRKLILLIGSISNGSIAGAVVIGLDISFMIGFLLLVGLALRSLVCGDQRISYIQALTFLMLATLLGYHVYTGISLYYRSQPWVFLSAGTIAVVFAPLSIKLALTLIFGQRNIANQEA